jgi:hypothetical protein
MQEKKLSVPLSLCGKTSILRVLVVNPSPQITQNCADLEKCPATWTLLKTIFNQPRELLEIIPEALISKQQTHRFITDIREAFHDKLA